ncbi:MAG: UbiA family prenyltransferase [Phycisphaerae bacterium]|nr:UbiA family prenyltransferase [Phycisphaerae bacterium]
MDRGQRGISVIEALGHLAVWAGWYAVGCVVMVCGVLGEPLRWRPLCIALVVTIGTYMLDRVGGWTRLPDRGDLAAVPRRVRFLRQRMPRVRSIATGLLVVGLVLALSEGWQVAVLVPAAVIGMLVYGHAPKRARLKDCLFIKNAVVAASLTGFSLVLVATRGGTYGIRAWTIVGVVLFFHVLAGAMLCDVDDREADARHGTKTFPNTIGDRWTWWMADVLVGVAGVLLLAGQEAGWVGGDHLVWLATLPLVGVVLLHITQPAAVRELVDVVFPVAVLFAMVL